MSVRTRQRGLALVTAVLVVALAATIAAFIAFGQQLWLRQMENMADRARADFLQRGALAWGLIALEEDRNKSVDHLGEDWARPLPPLPVPGGAIRASVEDAQGRFNLNNLWRQGGLNGPDSKVFENLLIQLDLAVDLRDALAEWLHPNGGRDGAADIEYLQLDPPYRAGRQGHHGLTSVDELRLVRGFTAEVVEKLRPYVTVIPVPVAVNVNTASAPVLAAMVDNMTAAQAEQIVEARKTTPFSNDGEFRKQLPPGLAVVKDFVLDVRTSYFLVMLDIAMGRHYRRAEALLLRPPGGGQGGGVIWHRTRPVLVPSDETERTQ